MHSHHDGLSHVQNVHVGLVDNCIPVTQFHDLPTVNAASPVHNLFDNYRETIRSPCFTQETSTANVVPVQSMSFLPVDTSFPEPLHQSEC